MSILDSVTPAAWMHDLRQDTIHNYAKELWLAVRSKQVEHYTKPLYSRETVGFLLAENRKQVLLGAAEKIDYKSGYPMSDMWRKHCADELRRMAESDKGGNDND